MTLNILLDKEIKKVEEVTDIIKKYNINHSIMIMAYCKAWERSAWAITYKNKYNNSKAWKISKPYALNCVEKYAKRLSK